MALLIRTLSFLVPIATRPSTAGVVELDATKSMINLVCCEDHTPELIAETLATKTSTTAWVGQAHMCTVGLHVVITGRAMPWWLVNTGELVVPFQLCLRYIFRGWQQRGIPGNGHDKRNKNY